MQIRKSDLIGSFILGILIAGLFLVLLYTTITVITPQIRKPPVYYFGSLIAFPLLASIGMLVITDLSNRFSGIFLVLRQFYKFGLVGVLNTLIDLTILNALIVSTGLSVGAPFSLFKGTSFIAAVINSYIWNKFWTFRKNEKRGALPITEFIKFFIITVIGLGINVGVASLLVNVIGPPAGIKPQFWANVSALFAIVFSMIWNFAGYRMIVFKATIQKEVKSI